MSDSIPELKASYVLLQSEVSNLKDAVVKGHAELQKLTDAHEVARKRWWRVQSVVLGIAVVVGYIGLNFYNTAKDALAQSIEDTRRQSEKARSELTAHVDEAIKPGLRQTVDTMLERSSLNLAKLNTVASRMAYDDEDGALVMTCNMLRIQPQNERAQASGTRILLGFDNNPHRGVDVSAGFSSPANRPDVPHLQPVLDAYLGSERVLASNFGTVPSITLKCTGPGRVFAPESPVVVDQELRLMPAFISTTEWGWTKDAVRTQNPFGGESGLMWMRSSHSGPGWNSYVTRQRTPPGPTQPMWSSSLDQAIAPDGKPSIEGRVRDDKGNVVKEHRVEFK